MKNNIKDYSVLSLGVALIAAGFAGLSYTNKIAFKLKKRPNTVSSIAGAMAIIGTLISVYILDKNLYPEDESLEEETENA